MKRGYVDLIDENSVIVILDDNKKMLFSLNDINICLKERDVVYIEKNKIVRTEKPSKKQYEEIKQLEKELFSDFSSKKNNCK